jgi:hypothetical protein
MGRVVQVVGRIDVMEETKEVNVWKLKASTAKYLICDLCGGDVQSWGLGKGRFRLCAKHNNWRTYFRLKRRTFRNAVERGPR